MRAAILGVVVALLGVARADLAAALTCGDTEVTESSSQAVTAGNSGMCFDPMTGYAYATSYYRAFDLVRAVRGGS